MRPRPVCLPLLLLHEAVHRTPLSHVDCRRPHILRAEVPYRYLYPVICPRGLFAELDNVKPREIPPRDKDAVDGYDLVAHVHVGLPSWPLHPRNALGARSCGSQTSGVGRGSKDWFMCVLCQGTAGRRVRRFHGIYHGDDCQHHHTAPHSTHFTPLHPTPHIPHPTPHTNNSTPHTRHRSPFTIHHAPDTRIACAIPTHESSTSRRETPFSWACAKGSRLGFSSPSTMHDSPVLPRTNSSARSSVLGLCDSLTGCKGGDRSFPGEEAVHHDDLPLSWVCTREDGISIAYLSAGGGDGGHAFGKQGDK